MHTRSLATLETECAHQIHPSPPTHTPVPTPPARLQTLAALAAAITTATIGHASAAPDVQHYDLTVAIDPATLWIDGDAVLTIRAQPGDGPVHQIVLDLAGFSLDSVQWQGADADHVRDGDKLTVSLSTPLLENQSGDLTLSWHGIPEPYVTENGRLGVLQDDGITYAINVTEGAHYWFPCRDRLDDKAGVDLALVLPPGYRSAGPGHLEAVETLPDGREVHRWTMSQEVTPYLLSFAFSNRYRREHYTLDLDTGPLEADVVLSAEQWPEAWADLEPLPQMLNWLEARYGRFPYDQVGFHEIPYPGAVEQPGNIAMGSFYWTGAGLLSQYFAHELSHTWFQGLVTIRTWDDIFLSEGIATWHELLWIEETSGPDAADLMALTYLEAYRIGVLEEGLFPLSDPDVVFGYTTYMKGAVVWRLLEHLLGRDALIELLRTYLADPDGIADLADFESLLDATGNPDVAMFQEEWLDRPGIAAYRFGWRAGPSEDGIGVALRLTQEPGPLYTTPIDVELAFEDGHVETHTLHPSSADHLELLCLDTAPVDVRLDPHYFVPREAEGTVVVDTAPDGACQPEPQGCEGTAEGRFAAFGPVLAVLSWLPWRRRRNGAG